MKPNDLIPPSPTYLLSCNGADGFFGIFDEVFRTKDFCKIFIISGGPGTGKSTAMKKAREEAIRIGARTESFLCSSDPDSLDGVILEKNGRRVGILDGTSPHARTLASPGYKEDIWDFGAFWDRGKLARQSEAIIAAETKKKAAYRHAYACLRAAGCCHEELAAESGACLLSDKFAGHIARRGREFFTEGETSRRFIRAYSMKGERVLPGLFSEAAVIFSLDGYEETAEHYLSLLEETVAKHHIRHTVLSSPLLPDRSDGIWFPGERVLYIKKELLPETPIPTRNIRLCRFTDPGAEKETKSRAVFLRRQEQSLVAGALAALSEAGKAHFALEAIYAAAMDYDALSDYVHGQIEEIRDLLTK